MHETAAFCLVAAAIWFVPFRVVLTTRLFQFLGRISFMVYLLQLPVLCFVGAGAVLLLAPHIGYNLATILAAVAFIAATLAAATLLTHLIDIPAIRASRRLASALSASPARPISAASYISGQ
jgi:peptidoglycan/LPS O-acetylase OafA/YrhL